MQTRLSPEYLTTPAGRRADAILRACVHCGFCNATCPTYQLLGDELDGPRGRIYLIKDLLEAEHGVAPPDTGGTARQKKVDPDIARLHLDRCLTCRACETTCPSGVAYGELAEIGREALEPRARRELLANIKKKLLLNTVPYPDRVRKLLRVARLVRPLLPATLAAKIPEAKARSRTAVGLSVGSVGRKVILLQGCIQRVATPEANLSLTLLLARAGIAASEVPDETCCGSLSLHLGKGALARNTMRANIDALWPHVEGAEAILSTASGCGTTLKDYGRLLADDSAYAVKAATVSALVRDASEFVAELELAYVRRKPYRRIAWHSPCTLQHGQRISGTIEAILTGAGYELMPVRDSNVCCGSAGSYSVLQPKLSEELRQRKLDALTLHQPDAIATANVGCQLHLAADPQQYRHAPLLRRSAPPPALPVVHWLELLG
jgi:glycolate oxidase iron-sulfur subunit